MNGSTIKTFEQHGLRVVSESNGHSVCNCIFCGSAKKLYVNNSTLAWDCKVCGKAGGVTRFLTEISAWCRDNLRDGVLSQLATLRSIPEEELKRHDIGYNVVTKQYTIPVYDKERITDLRTYGRGKLISTAGCKVGLWNSRNITADHDTIYLCEGEWDGMVMSMIAPKNCGVVAVPGAGTFKAQWCEVFANRNVIVLYDNDDAGRQGAIRCYNTLISVAKSMKFLRWPKDTPAKYDIRDLWKDLQDGGKILDYISANLNDIPECTDEPTGISILSESGTDGPGATAEEVYEEYQKWLHLPDIDIIDILYGAILANRLPGDPIWLFLVAPSGMTKSELLNSVSAANGIYTVSTLTPQSLASGMVLHGGADPSLIPKLNNKVLVVKDFTTILQMYAPARAEVFASLRDAYDRNFKKTFGNGVTRIYNSKFGIVAGVTPVVEAMMEGEAALGERFVRWSVPGPRSLNDHYDMVRRSVGNVSLEEDMRKALQAIANKCLKHSFDTNVIIDERILRRLSYVSIIVSQLRGIVPRDRYSKEVTAYPYSEVGTRLCKQFAKMLIGICMFHRVITPTDHMVDIVVRLASGTIATTISRTISVICQHFGDRVFRAVEVERLTGLPCVASTAVLDNMALLGTVVRAASSSSPYLSDYRLSPSFANANKIAKMF